MAQLIREDGSVEEFTGSGKVGKNGKAKITLDDAYRAIACDTVETVDLNGRKVMIIDEEGKFNGKPNRAATLLWIDRYGPTDIIFGDVLVTQGEGWG